MKKFKQYEGMIAVVVAVLVLGMTPISVAQEVGVEEGDWVKYGHFTASWSGTGTEDALATLKDIDWMKVEVKSVSGTEVTAETTILYKNGATTPSSTTTIDVATGEGTGGGLFIVIMLIAADLEEGDSIPQQYGSALEINGTVTRIYCGATRSVNFIELTVSTPEGTSTAEAYWDQATGVLMETSISASVTTPTAQSLEFSFKAIETNIWSSTPAGWIAENLYTVVAIIVVVVVVGAGAFLAIRRRKRLTTEALTPPATPEVESA